MKLIKNLIVFVSLFFTNIAFAQLGDRNSPSIQNPIKSATLQAFIADILAIAVKIGAVIAVMFFIYAGFLYIKAQGNEEKISEAHRTLLWTAIGTAVLLGAQVLATVISGTVNQLGGPTL